MRRVWSEVTREAGVATGEVHGATGEAGVVTGEAGVVTENGDEAGVVRWAAAPVTRLVNWLYVQ